MERNDFKEGEARERKDKDYSYLQSRKKREDRLIRWDVKWGRRKMSGKRKINYLQSIQKWLPSIPSSSPGTYEPCLFFFNLVGFPLNFHWYSICLYLFFCLTVRQLDGSGQNTGPGVKKTRVKTSRRHILMVWLWASHLTCRPQIPQLQNQDNNNSHFPELLPGWNERFVKQCWARCLAQHKCDVNLHHWPPFPYSTCFHAPAQWDYSLFYNLIHSPHSWLLQYLPKHHFCLLISFLSSWASVSTAPYVLS